MKKHNSLIGKSKSELHKQHIKEARTGTKLKTETKEKIREKLKSKNLIGKTKWICNIKLGISKKLSTEEAIEIVSNNSDWKFGRIRTWKNQREK